MKLAFIMFGLVLSTNVVADDVTIHGLPSVTYYKAYQNIGNAEENRVRLSLCTTALNEKISKAAERSFTVFSTSPCAIKDAPAIPMPGPTLGQPPYSTVSGTVFLYK
jgi:hypothetical protein